MDMMVMIFKIRITIKRYLWVKNYFLKEELFSAHQLMHKCSDTKENFFGSMFHKFCLNLLFDPMVSQNASSSVFIDTEENIEVFFFKIKGSPWSPSFE